MPRRRPRPAPGTPLPEPRPMVGHRIIRTVLFNDPDGSQRLEAWSRDNGGALHVAPFNFKSGKWSYWRHFWES
jgi:hypothetical protein